MAKRVLVMVLAFDAEPWRTIQRDGQRGTWATSDAVFPIVWLHGLSRGPVRFLYRSAIFVLSRVRLGPAAYALTGVVGRWSARRRVDRIGDRIETRVPETYVMTNAKTVAALRHVLATESFDYLLRTNSSTYVDLFALKQYVEGLPETGYYGGTPWTYEGLEYATGTSILLSRDLVSFAAEDPHWDFAMLDDVALGRSMRRAGAQLDAFLRIDIYTAADLDALVASKLSDSFIVRCRGDEGRDHDVRAMRRIHELVHAGRAS